MYSITQCTGFFIKQSKQQQKQFKIYYFYIDHQGIMYYLRNLAQLNYLIKNSVNHTDLVNKLNNAAQVQKLSVQNCRTSGLKQFPSFDYVPFYHRNCFELQVPNKKAKKDQLMQLYVFSTIEEDIDLLQEYIRGGWQKQANNLKNLSDSNDEQQDFQQKIALIDKVQKIFSEEKSYQIQIISSQAQHQPQAVQADVTYTGQLVNEQPEGQGTLFFVKEGISFVGEFENGKKHGSGYIVDSNLDMIYCEFINDKLSGI